MPAAALVMPRAETPVAPLPFTQALGGELETAHPLTARHFSQSPGVCRYRGTMHDVWRRKGWRGRLAGLALAFSSRRDMLFSRTGQAVEFELENEVSPWLDGRTMMSWKRTFFFEEGAQCFYAEMVYDAERGLIVDYLGNRGQLEVELETRVENGAMCIASGRQWWHIGKFRLALPDWLKGSARVRESYNDAEGKYNIEVVISNRLLGEFFGYYGSFDLVETH
jgi:hypothetical protein